VARVSLGARRRVGDHAPNALTLDLDADTISLFGVRYSLAMFRTLSIAMKGRRFEVVARSDDGVLTLKDLPLEMDRG